MNKEEEAADPEEESMTEQEKDKQRQDQLKVTTDLNEFILSLCSGTK